jgi:hypothetical protein
MATGLAFASVDWRFELWNPKTAVFTLMKLGSAVL